MPVPGCIKNWEDLVTTHEATRAGFISIALEKNFQANPYVAEANSLKTFLQKAKSAEDLLNFKNIYPAILTAAGLSDKSLPFLDESDKEDIVKNFIDKILKPSGESFADELVYRFLLTRGDSLGGKIRNIIGIIGERKFKRGLISCLSIQGIPFEYKNDISTKKWLQGNPSKPDIENDIKVMYWKNNTGERVLYLNITPPFITFKVDMCLFNSGKDNNFKDLVKDNNNYIALGELKAGIDPAGADEHWKTARSALERIRDSFAKNRMPNILFIGAAIEDKMAKEIYSHLQNGLLSNAANLTIDLQFNSICDWICSL